MATTEHTINDALAEALRGTRRAWRSSDVVRSANPCMLKGSSGRPDILVIEPNVSPVAVETEVLPAANVEAKAVSRLGRQLRSTGRMILSSVAVRVPRRLREERATALRAELTGATDLEMALYTGSDASTCTRQPRTGWMRGGVADLSVLIQSASMSPGVIDEAADFQRLVTDRKLLAAYYTTPASAALVVGLALAPEATPNGCSWSNADDVKRLRIADFACGTGVLLSTAYRRVGQLHELAGGDSEALHSEMMKSALVGCDVLPAAAHLTASMLAGAHPTVKFERSCVMTVAYGKQPGGGIALGALELLDPQGAFEKETRRTLPHASFDVVLMNPPFTRPTGHEGRKVGVHNPMFAAFSSSVEEQRLMGDATKRLTAGTKASGNAGEASIFLLLADRKLRPGGVLALVMPLSLMSGDAWKHARSLLSQNYSELILASIAGGDGAGMSFSADTGMGECLVVGRKSKTGGGRATFVILDERPAYTLLGASAAKQINQLVVGKNLRRLEDGPVGGTPLYFGGEVIGQALDAPLPSSGVWNLSRISDLSLAQTAYQLAVMRRVWLPTLSESDAACLPLTTVGAAGKIGPLHLDIQYDARAGSLRGPFDISAIRPGGAPTYPVLWSHDAERERTMSFDADSEGTPHHMSSPEAQAAVGQKVQSVWATASHCHFNQNFQFNSQSTGMQFTPRRTIGGRAWLSIQLPSAEQEKALVLWGNTSLGLLLHWWHANRQQAGRGNVGKAALQTLPVLDVSALTPAQLAAAVRLFDEVCGLPLLPLHELERDAVRKQLDAAFARDVLGLAAPLLAADGPLELLRTKLGCEPSIRGGK